MKCIYHNDMDGRCAGALVARYTGNYNEDDFIECSYTQFPLHKIERGESVYIVDYSFTDATVHILRQMIEKQCNIVWIDHHTSSIQLQDKYEYEWLKRIDGIRDESQSGAGLTYSYFHSMECHLDVDKLPKFVQLVDDYDRWVYRLGEDTTYFKLGLETIEFDALDSIWRELMLSDEKVDSIIAVGAIIKQYIDKSNASYLKSYSYESTISGLPCLVINKRTNSWIFADKIDEYPIVATFVFDGEWYHYSLYSSDKTVDCSKIAEQYGGGGHKGAAGFKLNRLIFDKRS